MKRPAREPRTYVTAPAPKRRPRPAFVAAGSAVAGFITGALFWHTIGFWNFVSDVVLKGPDEAQSIALAQQSPTVPVAMRPTGSISPARTTVGGRGPSAAKSHLSCSLAVPGHEETSVSPCPPGTLPAPTKSLAKKGDLLGVVAPVQEAAPQLVLTAPPPLIQPSPTWAATIKGSVR
jgi:hypothetical protein